MASGDKHHGELMLRCSAKLHAGVRGGAVEEDQEWTRAEGVGEELEHLQHGEHVAPVGRAGCEKHVDGGKRAGFGGISLAADLGPACAVWRGGT